MSERCENCRFAHRHHVWLECRRHAPASSHVADAVNVLRSIGLSQLALSRREADGLCDEELGCGSGSIWPVVDATDWCGEFAQTMTKPDPNWTRRWLKHARITDDPVGNLISDMRTDPDIPRLFENLKAMGDYVTSKSSDPLMLEAVPGAWLQYRNWMRDFSSDDA